MNRHKVEPKVPEPGVVSDEETEEGDFTVYECPGLAPVSKKKCFDWHLDVRVCERSSFCSQSVLLQCKCRGGVDGCTV